MVGEVVTLAKPRGRFISDLERSAKAMEADTEQQATLMREWWVRTTRGGTRRPTQENIDELLRHATIIGGRAIGLSPNLLMVLQEDDAPTFRNSVAAESEHLSAADKVRDLGKTVFSGVPDMELTIEEIGGISYDQALDAVGDLTEMPGLDTAARRFEQE